MTQNGPPPKLPGKIPKIQKILKNVFFCIFGVFSRNAGVGPFWVLCSNLRVISGPGDLGLSHWRPESQPLCCAKICAVCPGFPRVVGELRAADSKSEAGKQGTSSTKEIRKPGRSAQAVDSNQGFFLDFPLLDFVVFPFLPLVFFFQGFLEVWWGERPLFFFQGLPWLFRAEKIKESGIRVVHRNRVVRSEIICKVKQDSGGVQCGWGGLKWTH